MTSWIEYNHILLNNFWDLTKQNNLITTTISTQALYNPYFNLQTTSRFPQHFYSFGYTSFSKSLLYNCGVFITTLFYNYVCR